MLNRLIFLSLQNPLLVLSLAVAVIVLGSWQALELNIDVFPDLNRPTVTVMTEAPGLAPEEVEMLVTFPLETALSGASGVRHVHTASGIGLSVVHVGFEWGADIHIARQTVNERLQLARDRLPQQVRPVMTPITSIMGEIMLVGLQSDGRTAPRELRTLADRVVRQRLLAVPGIAQVSVLGGEVRQYQVLTSPDRLIAWNVTLDELTDAVRASNAVAAGGFLPGGPEETLIRIMARVSSPEDILNTVVRPDEPVPVTVADVADVRIGGPVPRGDASIGGVPAVILSLQKQPGADTLALTRAVDRRLEEISRGLPAGVRIDAEIFRQATFIQTAISNVVEAIRDGAFWVVIVLVVFLWNLRMSAITLVAIPLSLLLTALMFRTFGIPINTMTLGGLAVAIGELVDDSIVDIENICRRLRENRRRQHPQPALQVIYLASAEIRNAIVYGTMIVVLVVLPLLSLGGLEGRMFAPLALSYVLTLLSSLLVSLTVTPVLASWLLPHAKLIARSRDPVVLRMLKAADERLLRLSIRHSGAVLIVAAALVIISLFAVIGMGGSFLPDFNEGTLTIGAALPAGSSLQESNRIGTQIEQMLLEIPEVTHVSRRTGRAELDEHAEDVNFSEIDVGLAAPERPRPGWHRAVLRAIPGLQGWGIEETGRPREAVLSEIRERLSEMPELMINIGQPVSHRLDHLMSGIRLLGVGVSGIERGPVQQTLFADPADENSSSWMRSPIRSSRSSAREHSVAAAGCCTTPGTGWNRGRIHRARDCDDRRPEHNAEVAVPGQPGGDG